VLIGAITMLARVIGFGRQVVFAHTVRASCLGTAYTTANMVPNIIYDIVMGGALTAVVVPVLAGPVLAGPVLAGPGGPSVSSR
jgi:putative peptidoglycan lipid II flippase